MSKWLQKETPKNMQINVMELPMKPKCNKNECDHNS